MTPPSSLLSTLRLWWSAFLDDWSALREANAPGYTPRPSPPPLAPPVPDTVSCLVLGIIKSLETEREDWKQEWPGRSGVCHWTHQGTGLEVRCYYQYDSGRPFGRRIYLSDQTLNHTERVRLLTALAAHDEHYAAIERARVAAESQVRTAHFTSLGCPPSP